MRSVIPILTAAAVAGCAPPPPAQVAAEQARSQARLAEFTAGKVAGAPQSCLPPYRSDDMVVIDDSTIVFRDGPSRVWVMRTQSPCNLLSSGSYALVTNTVGGLGLCRGDIGRVADTLNRATVGSCVMGDFVPYTRPGA
jgi:hypothetical protein